MSPTLGGSDLTKSTPQVAGRRRARRVWLVVAGVVIAGGLVAVSVWARVGAPTLQGALMTPPAPSYDFHLRDQDNHPVQLSAFRGKAVALTFLYTHCPDVCPLTAQKLHETYQRLGADAKRVAFIAVSVDPNGDTPDAIRTFLSAHHVDGELSYLTGSFAELKRVWGYYYVTSDAKEATPKSKTAAGTPASPDLVGHSSIIYVIDPSGNIRAFLPGNFDPKDLATDLKILAREPGR
jgi:protein SCO1